ncbi:MAG: 50S ribosomal protein L35 [Armatimonadetes bacterium]|nr:50S ribosomal protein L35 [Armatimonadota bacterium]
MPKMKTKKAAAKRFTLTGTGKLMHRSSGKGHLMMKKCAARRRSLGLETTIPTGDRRRVRRMMPGTSA